MFDLYEETRAQLARDDAEAEAAIAAMDEQQRKELKALTADYSMRRRAMMRQVWRERATRRLPSLRTCAAISTAAIIIILVWAV